MDFENNDHMRQGSSKQFLEEEMEWCSDKAHEINKFKMVSELLTNRIDASSDRLSRNEKVHRGKHRIELRSKSVSDLSRIKLFKPEYNFWSVSCLNLNEVEKYAQAKAKEVEFIFGDEAEDKNGDVVCLSKKDFENELLVATNLFDDKSVLNNETKFEFLRAMMGTQSNIRVIHEDKNNNVQNFLQVVKEFQSSVLMQYRGTTDKETVPQFDENNQIFGDTLNSAMKRYFELMLYKRQFFADARNFIMRIVQLKRNRNAQAFTLIDAYWKTFNCYNAQLEIVFDNVTRLIFNPYSLYHAEKTQSTSQVDNLIINFKRQLKIVFKNIFNFEIVRNHLGKIAHFSTVLKKRQHAEIATQHAIMLINKTRIPEEFIPANATFSWLNSSAPQKSIDIMKFCVEDFVPVNFDEIEFLDSADDCSFAADFIKCRMRDIHGGGLHPIAIIFSAIFDQSESIFDLIWHFLPDGMDRRMALYYQNQFLTHIWRLVCRRGLYISSADLIDAPKVCNSIVLSTITALPVRFYNLRIVLEDLDSYRTSLLERYVVPPFIPPPSISNVVSIFENALYISIGLENDLSSLKDSRLEASKKIPTFKENTTKIVTLGENSLLLMVDFKSHRLFGRFINEVKNESISERFFISYLPRSINKDNVNWEWIEKVYIKENEHITNNVEVSGAEILKQIEILSRQFQKKPIKPILCPICDQPRHAASINRRN